MEKPHVKYSKASLSKKDFWKNIFALLKIFYQDIVEAFFEMKALEANAKFYVLNADVQRLWFYQKL